VSRLPVAEGRVACPHERHDLDVERCLVCPRLIRVAPGVVECEGQAPGPAWLRAALASLFAS
jgi:hypothetical protein